MKNGKEKKVIPLPVVRIVDGKPVVTSLEIAERFVKDHCHVIEAIKNLECSQEFNQSNFRLIEKGYQDTRGRWQPRYLIFEEGFYFLAMGFMGARAAQMFSRI